MNEINANFCFEPYEWQREALTAFNSSVNIGNKLRKPRNLVCAVARQHGKSELAIIWQIDTCLSGNEKTHVGYFAPTRLQGERDIWPRLKDK